MATWTQVCIPIPTTQGLVELRDKILDFILEYPASNAAALILLSYYPTYPFQLVYNIIYAVPRAVLRSILGFMGFESEGIGRGTWAAEYQSRRYGGHTPGDSLFSAYQSYGALDPTLRETRENQDGVLTRSFGWVCFISAIIVLCVGFANEITANKS